MRAHRDQRFVEAALRGMERAALADVPLAEHPRRVAHLLQLVALPLCARQPNIVLIMADDLGWTDLGCFGSKYYETPAIDRLAAGGMRLTNHHHCQNCTPTRAALLSGQYGARTGVYTVGGIDRFDWSKRPLRPVDNVTSLPLDRDTFADQLKKVGYATGMFGKWHIGES
ncbi:MAG: sulfatase-like hydrolase/transferase, partial [Verrucomicrobiota bacterium]